MNTFKSDTSHLQLVLLFESFGGFAGRRLQRPAELLDRLPGPRGVVCAIPDASEAEGGSQGAVEAHYCGPRGLFAAQRRTPHIFLSVEASVVPTASQAFVCTWLFCGRFAYMGDAESPVSLEEVLRETSFEPAPVRSRCSAWQALWLAPLAGWAVAVWQISDTDRPVPAAPFAVIAVGTTVTTGWLTALNHPCEFVATLGYRGTLCLYAGALITLTCRVALGEPDASGGALFGLLLVGSGLVMWACATFVQGPIPYMRGASLLVIGVQLRIGTAAAALSDAGVDRTSLAVCEAVAVACWLPGIASLLAKAYEEMRPPWLSAPNHNFGAFLIFGLGLACDAAIGLSYFCDDPVDLRGLDGAGGSAPSCPAAKELAIGVAMLRGGHGRWPCALRPVGSV
ncbi:hypothetical protein EMIHUDRAFT_215960 [Emiliania huxleyi CCMP1516]|uniref:EamA domain-containing protein n=2 Tax=Emiliania huxleyi TaxID=2903 RepID=A0A0D3IG78_EMIH1|nr:hypothetical protein EMIHUDRAFT_215960 [Emiliania huxleyi CCMP1516]EOD10263.1 hypothetical protein EMIHUDRAFT_215960 [Emiliania huxleyi CCMP1516]|eukprot:XP_005762692.1 hypothetical protein EMIHUDRAFT_215960 [Emiliania huxleyi CCMP1516]